MCHVKSVALITIIRKLFKRLVMAQIKENIDFSADPHQHAYRQNLSTADVMSWLVQ